MLKLNDPRRSAYHDRYVAAAADMAETLDTLQEGDWVPRLSAFSNIVDVDLRNFRCWLKTNLPELLERHAAACERHHAWQLEQYEAARAEGQTKYELHQRLGLPIKLCHGLDPVKTPNRDWHGLFARHRAFLAQPRTMAELAAKMGVGYNSVSNVRQRRAMPAWVGAQKVANKVFLFDLKVCKGLK